MCSREANFRLSWISRHRPSQAMAPMRLCSPGVRYALATLKHPQIYCMNFLLIKFDKFVLISIVFYF